MGYNVGMNRVNPYEPPREISESQPSDARSDSAKAIGLVVIVLSAGLWVPDVLKVIGFLIDLASNT